MGEVEKPFGCPEPDCCMSFTNEDHLQVHRRRHEMQSNASHSNGQMSSLIKKAPFIIDQTPTPTCFLRHCTGDEVSLFQDFNLNPFDVEFKKASLCHQISFVENYCPGGSLETPHILPLVDSDETISSTSKDETHIGTSHPSNILMHVEEDCGSSPDRKDGRKRLTLNVSSAADASQGTTSIISTPTPVITAGPSVAAQTTSGGASSTLNTPTIIPAQQQINIDHPIESSSVPQITINSASPELHLADKSSASIPTLNSVSCNRMSNPVSVLQANQRLILPNLSRNGTSCRMVSAINNDCLSSVNSMNPFKIKDEIINNSISSSTSFENFQKTTSSLQSELPQSPSSATVLQLVLKLPNGQSIPVEIPATPVVSSAANSTFVHSAQRPHEEMTIEPPIVSEGYPTQQTSVIANVTSLTKMKLKAAVESLHTAARPLGTKFSRANTADRIAEMTRKRSSEIYGYSTDELVENNSSDSSRTSSNATYPPQLSSGGKSNRKRRTSEECHPDEKRDKFLARNRAAAVRCREKKKRFVECLASRSSELQSSNMKMQTEIVALREEVASLKSLLLKHKDCSVTLAALHDEHAKLSSMTSNHQTCLSTNVPITTQQFEHQQQNRHTIDNPNICNNYSPMRGGLGGQQPQQQSFILNSNLPVIFKHDIARNEAPTHLASNNNLVTQSTYLAEGGNLSSQIGYSTKISDQNISPKIDCEKKIRQESSKCCFIPRRLRSRSLSLSSIKLSILEQRSAES